MTKPSLTWTLAAAATLASSCLQRSVSSGIAAERPEFAEAAEAFGAPLRVGGDLQASAERIASGGDKGADAWSFGPCRITTALPEGYPAPTPPGALELKSYPRARRAQVGGAVWPDMGMNVAFWPLFQHIKSRDIAMTSPVEMDYSGMLEDGRLATADWTMSFLYREPDMGVVEQDGVVTVVDREPLLVLSLGMRGDYSWARSNEGATRLREWLEADGDWEVAGAPRALYYNGPERAARDKWSEVQVPVRRVRP